MSKFQHNVTYYYQGGREAGAWAASSASPRDLMAAGYPAVAGSRAAGAPVGYPRISLRKKTNELCGAPIWPEDDCGYCGDSSCMRREGHCAGA